MGHPTVISGRLLRMTQQTVVASVNAGQKVTTLARLLAPALSDRVMTRDDRLLSGAPVGDALLTVDQRSVTLTECAGETACRQLILLPLIGMKTLRT